VFSALPGFVDVTHTRIVSVDLVATQYQDVQKTRTYRSSTLFTSLHSTL
jgi:hypothetical protein